MKDQDLSTLIALRDNVERSFSSGIYVPGTLINDWRLAGYPPVPFPVEIWGDVLLSNGRTRPVAGHEAVFRMDRGSETEMTASAMVWHDGPRKFRRKLADHPGDSYRLGAVETVPADGKVDLKVWEVTKVEGLLTRRADWHTWSGLAGYAFQRVLELSK